MKIQEFDYNGYKATVILPEKPNGKWVWKTEFLYAFDQAERALLEEGYTRVYYSISNRYGSPKAVRLMHAFHKALLKKYPFLQEKANLFGFSRGGLYAFNYALFYPEYVERVYLDAPVLDVRSWPPKGSKEQAQLFEELSLTEEALQTYVGNPVNNIKEYIALQIPTLLVVGDADAEVPLRENGQVLIDEYERANATLSYIVKQGCAHHPHSLEDVTPILQFIGGKKC